MCRTHRSMLLATHRVISRIDNVNLGSMLCEDFDDFGVFPVCGKVQRPPTGGARHVGMRTVLQKQCYNRRVAPLSGQVKWWESAFLRSSVGVCSGRKQALRHGNVPLCRCEMQRSDLDTVRARMACKQQQ